MRHVTFVVLAVASAACSGGSTPVGGPPAPSPAPATEEIGSPAWVRAKIERFRGDPTVITGAPIVAYAEKSEDVAVVLRSSLVTFDGVDDELELVLVAAFVAGNVEAQLEAGQTKDMPVEGVRTMIAVYATLKRASPDLTIPRLEAFQSAEADGRLTDAVEAAIAEQPPSDARPE
jgi:hypothetical protein